jgi:hypothetical protein
MSFGIIDQINTSIDNVCVSHWERDRLMMLGLCRNRNKYVLKIRDNGQSPETQ